MFLINNLLKTPLQISEYTIKCNRLHNEVRVKNATKN